MSHNTKSKAIETPHWAAVDTDGNICFASSLGERFVQEHIQDAIEDGIEGANKWVVRPVVIASRNATVAYKKALYESKMVDLDNPDIDYESIKDPYVRTFLWYYNTSTVPLSERVAVAVSAVVSEAIDTHDLSKPRTTMQLAGWQFRCGDQPTKRDAVEWKEWELCKPRNVYVHTDRTMAEEILSYIRNGYNYQIRHVYAGPVFDASNITDYKTVLDFKPEGVQASVAAPDTRIQELDRIADLYERATKAIDDAHELSGTLAQRIATLIEQRNILKEGNEQLRELLAEVSANLTRDDDLPDDLLPRIDSVIDPS